MRGESVDGQRLAFRPVPGEAPGPPPDAVLKVRFDSFGDEFPIQGLSLAQFDGSTSRGDGLTYVIEFGDGEVSTQPTVTHRFDRAQAVSTQLTVVDRFGCTDTEVETCLVWSLADDSYGSGWFYNPVGGGLQFRFLVRQGLTLTGTCVGGAFSSRFVATLSGERDIHIVLDGVPIEFDGHFELRDFRLSPTGSGSPSGPTVILRQSGGPDDGRTWVLTYSGGS